jgi:hypothetical protein
MYTEISAISMERESILAFANVYRQKVRNFASLSDIKTSSVREALTSLKSDIFKPTIDQMKLALKNPKVGLCGVDIPHGLSENPQEDSALGCLASVALTTSIFNPIDDIRNQTPFTLYNASRDNEDQLKKVGVKYYSPEDRIGFHTDGFLKDGAVSVPKFIAIYNVMIAYRKPGNFYYLPLEMWEEKAMYQEAIGLNRDITFSMTPIVYGDKDGNISAIETSPVTAPMFWRNSEGQRAMFFNGDVEKGPKEVIDLVKSMKESLLDNPRRIACPIRNRRLFVMANDKGLHARDIFADPIDGVPYTRSFLRFVSQEAHLIKDAQPELIAL